MHVHPDDEELEARHDDMRKRGLAPMVSTFKVQIDTLVAHILQYLCNT